MRVIHSFGDDFKNYGNFNFQVPHIYTCTEHSKEDELPKFVSHHNVFNNTVIIKFLSSVDTDSIFVNTLPADISEDGLEIQ